MQIRVHGVPAPQGSKKAFVRGNRAVIVEQSDKVKPWRQAVVSAAIDVRGDTLQLEGALQVNIIFFLPRPKTVAKSRIYPNVKPDLDKLIRSTLDGLTDSGIWHDDAQVTHITASKRYSTAEVEKAPGALIVVSRAA